MSTHHSRHLRACVWLFVATAFWGLSFPFIKSIWMVQEKLLPNAPSIFLAATGAGVRFGVAGILIVLFSLRTLRNLTRLELEQGMFLGVFGGLGIVVQMDGLAHTAASVSAFLTQFYCLLIPIWVAAHRRVWPKAVIAISSIMVLAGVAILAQVDWRLFKIGRGEAETLLAAIFFAGQILVLERPRYTANRARPFTAIMFLTISVLVTPVALITAPSAGSLVEAYRSIEVVFLMGGVILFCTLGAYILMNVWQPHVTATEAGLIYCIEPLFASCFALILPGWISRLAGIDYPNERLTSYLLIGGGLITAANLLIQIDALWLRRRAATVMNPS